MRKYVLTLLIASTLAGTTHAADPCETLLCMAGKLQGQSGGPECSGPIDAYFSILKFRKRMRFDAGATAAARLRFLNSCPAPGVGDWPSRINAAYGAVRLGF